MTGPVLNRIPRSGRPLGLWLAGLGMFLISTDSLFTRVADTDGWTVAFFVGLWSTPITWMLAYHNLGNRIGVEIVRYGRPLLATAALSGVGTTSFIQAVTRTEVANCVAIIAAAPIFAALFARVAIREKTSGRTWRSIAATAVGILVIVGGSVKGGGVDGDLLALLSIVIFGINLVIWRRHLNMPRTLVVAGASMFVILIAIIPAQPLAIDGRAFVATLAMGLIFGPTARLCMATAARHASAAEVSLFAPVETVFASLWVWLWFGEVPPNPTFIGGTVVLIALFYGVTGPAAEVTPVPTSHT